MVNECVQFLVFVGVNDKSRGLVGDEYILVLIYDNEPRLLELRELQLLVGLVTEKLAVNIKRQNVTFVKDRVLLGTFSVELYSFGTDVFIHQRFRHRLEALRQKFVEPDAAVVLPYRNCFHLFTPTNISVK